VRGPLYGSAANRAPQLASLQRKSEVSLLPVLGGLIATPEAIAAAVPDAAADVVCLPTVAEALGHARSVAQGADVVCVTGSFHVVGEAMQALGVQPWEDAED